MKSILVGLSFAAGIASCAGVESRTEDLHPAIQSCIAANQKLTGAAVRAMVTNSAICYQDQQYLDGIGEAVKKACLPLISDPMDRVHFNDSLIYQLGEMKKNCEEQKIR